MTKTPQSKSSRPHSRHRLTSQTVMRSVRPLTTLPALFISHGVPTLAIEKNATTNALARIGQNLPKPQAIVIMSAHWVADSLTICNNPKPQTWHDFQGFSELNGFEYPALGHPLLAESLASQLNEFGVSCQFNPLRPLDHGVWSPLAHLYPEANVPIIQIALPRHFDAYACYQLGAMFEALRHEQILLIGSGNITHNLHRLAWYNEQEEPDAKTFKTWLLHQLKTDIPTALDWRSYPNIEAVHPTSEHLLPLFFALGAGQRVSAVHESMAHHSLGMDIYRFD